MGCDIHAWAEVRQPDGSWRVVTERVFPDPYWREENAVEDGSKYYHGPTTNRPISRRNYNLFAVLADVRNGRGFAGIPTGMGFEPISKPKGVPDDATPEYQKEVQDWGVDGHSHSWLTVAEILEFFKKTRTTVLFGVFSEREYVKMLRTGKKSYSGFVDGQSAVILNPEQYEEMLPDVFETLMTSKEPKKRDPDKHYFIRYAWEQSYEDSIGPSFFEDTLPALEKLGPTTDVRLVFFFDN